MGQPAMVPPEPPDAERERSLSEVFGAMTTELAELADAGERLQAIIGQALLYADRPPDAVLIEEAQGLDALVQRLTALTHFVRALTGDMPEHWQLDVEAALALLPLSDLARRLGREDEGSSLHASGDFDLF